VSDNSSGGWDVFISYAREDREGFVIELVRALRRLGLSVCDQINIKHGQSIRREIDRGISKSRYGIAVLSDSYFLPTKTFRAILVGNFLEARSNGPTISKSQRGHESPSRTIYADPVRSKVRSSESITPPR
jgi:hypothetical protein